MKVYLLLPLTAFVLFLSMEVRSEEPLVTIEKTIDASNANVARRDILNAAMQEVATQKILEIIGSERFQQNRTAIQNQVLDQVARFVPVANPGPIQTVKQGTYKMRVELRVSTSSLKEVLQRQGFLYELDGPAKIFPAWSIVDKVNALSYRWWIDDAPTGRDFLLEIHREIEKFLYADFFDRGFYYLRTSVVNNPFRVEKGLLSERPRVTDLQRAADQHKASIVMRGDVDISRSRRIVGAYTVQIRFSAFQNMNSRTVAEVSRTFETEPGAFEAQIRNFLSSQLPEVARDLGVQIQEAWERGTFGTNLLQVSLPRLIQYNQYAETKKHLASSPKVKSVRDRRFGPNGTVFELDYTGSVQELEQSLRRMRSAQFPFEVESVGETEVRLKSL